VALFRIFAGGNCARLFALPLAAGLVLGLVLGLAGCGGGTAARAAAGAFAPATAEADARPTFHLAAAVLDEPPDVDADGSGSSAYIAPHAQLIDRALADLDSARLTPEAIAERLLAGAPRPGQTASPAGAAPAPLITVFTPAQIRAAYSLPPLPAAGSGLTAAQAASLGSGQTIYLVDAYDNPAAASDLATFNAKFGLPGCATVPITPATKLPLAAAARGSGCTFSVAYLGGNGLPTTSAPPYNAGWAIEIAMDVQWAHATAPLARIVLLEARGAALSQLTAAIALANRMGAGVVSMSFGAGEGSWVGSYDGLFSAAGSSYLASTGDAGAGVAWPSVSANVLAVGGTTLSYTGTGARSETAWTRTGGGLSAYEPEPGYQASVTVPGEPTARPGAKSTVKRAVADVAFNADPNSGQYLVVTSPGAKSPAWYSAGGTSIGAPQWAGILSVANAQRALEGKAPLGLAQNPLYQNIAAVTGLYPGAFLDVTAGRDGSCSSCAAGAGYDLPTGLGTPNAANLLGLLAAH